MNIKLASVATNIVGKSGLTMLRLLASGVHDAEQLADCALRKLRPKVPELILALDGRPDAHFCWMLSELLSKLDWLTEELARVDQQHLNRIALNGLSTNGRCDQTAAGA